MISEAAKMAELSHKEESLNKTKPILSVVCVTYNHEPYIRQALESILMQKTNFPFEVLIGEDCSQDASKKVLQEYENRYPGFFQMFYREKNLGGTNNLFDLIMRTKGKYIIVLETDDYWIDPYKLQKQVDLLEAHPEYIGCIHDYVVVNEQGEKTGERSCALDDKKRFTLQNFLNKGFVFQTTTLMYRNLYLDGSDYSVIARAHPMVSDLTINSILLSQGDFYIMSGTMSAYRCVIKNNGTNAASQSARDPANSLIATMRQLVILDDYFHGKIDYSSQKRYPVERYLTGVMRRENGFTTSGMRYMWKNAGKEVRKQTVQYAAGFPIRKLKKVLGSI